MEPEPIESPKREKKERKEKREKVPSMNILSFLKQKKKSSEPEKDEEFVDSSLSTGSLTDFIASHVPSSSATQPPVPNQSNQPSQTQSQPQMDSAVPTSNSANPTPNGTNELLHVSTDSAVPTSNSAIPTQQAESPLPTPENPTVLPSNSAMPTSTSNSAMPTSASNSAMPTSVSDSAIASLLAELKTRMQSYQAAALDRCAQLHRRGQAIASISTVSTVSTASQAGSAPAASDSTAEKPDQSMEIEPSEAEIESDSEEAIIEDTATNDAEILDVAPALLPAVSLSHDVMTIDKTPLTSSELLKLSFMIGFRYIHADTETPRRRIFFGISHKTGRFVTGRSPLSREEHVNYEEDSEEEEDVEFSGEEPQGDDCSDTESESGESESGNQLDYRDGFLEEEDINIGDANLTAEEKSALVFRSVSGNKGKRGEPAGIWALNQPFVMKAGEEPKFGIDLRLCQGVVQDPDFFVETVETLRKKRLELVEEVEVKRRVNITEEMVKVMSEIIAGQQFTISQVVEAMQRRFPGLPKRQIESKLHEIAEKRKKVWVIRPPPMMKVVVDIDSLMMTHGVESSPIKRPEAENSQTESQQKRIRIHTEKIPDRTILHGNISNSAFALDPHDDGPSSFFDVKPSCVVCFDTVFRAWELCSRMDSLTRESFAKYMIRFGHA